jgi:hypothetical protein
LKSFLEGLAGQARGDERQELEDDGAGIAEEFPAGPEQAGIHGEGQAGGAQGAVKCCRSRLVGGRRIGSLPRTFRKDDDLAAGGQFLDTPGQKLAQRCRAGAALQSDHAEFEDEPAEERNPRELAFQDHAGVIETGKDGEGFPHGLMLAGHQNRAHWNIFFPAYLNMEPTDHPQQPQRGARPRLKGAHRHFSRGQEKNSTQHEEEREVQIESNIDNQRANRNHNTLLNMRMSAMREVTRQITVAMIGTLNNMP